MLLTPKRPQPTLQVVLDCLHDRGAKPTRELLVRIPRVHASRLLREAAEQGQCEAVVALADALGPGKACTEALKAAAEGGHLATVEALIPVSNPRADASEALSHAARKGHPDVVRALLPVSDPRADQSYALRVATQLGHTDVVNALLPVSDPTAERSEALLNATGDWAWDLAEILLPFSHSDEAFAEALWNVNSAPGTGGSTPERERFLMRLLQACPQSAIDSTCRKLFSSRAFGRVEELLEWVSPTLLREVDVSTLADAPTELQAHWHARSLAADLPETANSRGRPRL